MCERLHQTAFERAEIATENDSILKSEFGFMRILVVEDERKIATFIQRGLRECGFVVDIVHRGDAALEIIEGNHFDAIVLDIMLPGRDGLSVLRTLRQRSNAVPVIVLTARGEIAEKVEGLDLGADDYLAKPFSIDELAARVRALLRRNW